MGRQKREIERFLRRYQDDIQKEAKTLLRQEMPKLTEQEFALYEKTGNRLVYEDKYFSRRKFLLVFGLQVWMEEGRKKKDSEKLEAVIAEICKERCWALPAHVDRTRPDWELTVDLFAAETAQALSEIISVEKFFIRREIRNLAKKEIYRRVLNPFLNKKSPYDWWENCTLNWCAVCNGSIGSAAMYLMDEEPERQRNCLKRVTENMQYFLAGYGEDGACLEGLSYFTYGMTYFTGFAEQLLKFTKGKIDLFANPKVEKIAGFQQKCYFGNGKTLSFSDGNNNEHFHAGLSSYLAKQYETVCLPSFSLAASLTEDSCYRWMGAFRDLLWTREYLEQMKEENGCFLKKGKIGQITLPDSQWVICENDTGTGMAVKGGHNGEPHNHNDVGSFLLFFGEEFFLPDLGAGEYTKKYFDEHRYEIFCNHSFSHNVPVIRGKGQQAGKQHCCTRFETDEKGHIILGLEEAYEKNAAKRIERKLKFEFSTGKLSVKDAFWKCGEIQENLISYIKPIIEEDRFLLIGKKAICCIQTQGKMLQIEERKHALHNGEMINVYRMLWNVEEDKGYAQSEFLIYFLSL